jgi:Flp pilus assembly protein TadB
MALSIVSWVTQLYCYHATALATGLPISQTGSVACLLAVNLALLIQAWQAIPVTLLGMLLVPEVVFSRGARRSRSRAELDRGRRRRLKRSIAGSRTGG